MKKSAVKNGRLLRLKRCVNFTRLRPALTRSGYAMASPDALCFACVALLRCTLL